MNTKFLTGLAVASFATAVPCLTQAAAITGAIGFSGTAQADSTSVDTSTKIVSWISNTVGASSGAFAGIAPGTSVPFNSPWNFDSGTVNNFWTVGGFTFNLGSSTASVNGAVLNASLTGTITGNGFTPTTFFGTFQATNSTAGGGLNYAENFSFSSNAPDGASTVALFGLTFLGLVLVRPRIRSA